MNSADQKIYELFKDDPQMLDTLFGEQSDPDYSVESEKLLKIETVANVSSNDNYQLDNLALGISEIADETAEEYFYSPPKITSFYPAPVVLPSNVREADHSIQDDGTDMVLEQQPAEPPETGNEQQREPGEKKKSKATTVISNLMFYVGVAVALLAVFAYSQNGTDKEILGFHTYHVLTSSMQSTIPQGSFVFVKTTADKNAIKVGDDITYYKDAATSVTHRVVEVIPNYEGTGQPGFRTKGTDNPSPDPAIVYATNVVGVVKLHIPYLGVALKFMAANIVFVMGGFAFLILFSFVLKMFFSAAKEEKEQKAKQKQNADKAIAQKS